MILSNQKDTIMLKVLGYQFPEAAEKSCSTEFNYDANWLNVYCEKHIDGKACAGTEPCIMTTDLMRGIRLLEDYQEKKIDRIDFGGMEPNLEIYLRRKHDYDLLKIRFWCESSGEACQSLPCFKKKISSEELNRIKMFFKEALERCPKR